MMKGILLTIPLFCLVMVGCSQEMHVADMPQTSMSRELSTQEYHASYQDAGNWWIGKNISELVLELGEPDVILEATPKGVSQPAGIHLDSYIYRSHPEAGRTCVEAYVVVYRTGEITKYYCR